MTPPTPAEGREAGGEAVRASKRMAKDFYYLVDRAKKILRLKYSEADSRKIELAFMSDPAEIVAIAARDIQNCLRRKP